MLREVSTKYGLIKGLPGADPRVTSFKGVPFALPPVGENRWRAPMPPKKWDGVLEAYKFAPISVQNRPGLGDDIYCREWHVDSQIEISEDSLYLNIWTPANKEDEKLPVFVWFFGGVYRWGYTQEMEFDGERLARKGIIVVTVNYRLNVFGFMAHPEITKENPKACSNFGFLDQQAGIKWVYENIAAFGGDPENITIGGQSAGGGSVLAQITNLKNEGMVKKAIIMSGVIDTPYKAKIDKQFRGMQDVVIGAASFPPPAPLKDAEEWGVEFFKFLGVNSLEEARKIDQDTILEKYDEFLMSHSWMLSVNDGEFIKGDPIMMASEGHILDIPILAGNTADEFMNFICASSNEEYEKKVHDIFGQNDGDKFLTFDESKKTLEDGQFAPVSGIELSDKLLFESLKDNGFSNDYYYYRFNADIPGEDNPGTFHSVDLWFAFETLAKCSRAYEGHHYDLARKMSNYFVNFIKCGNPNGMDTNGEPMPEWIPYTKETPYEMEFTKNGPMTRRESSSEFKTFLKGKMGDLRRKEINKKQAFNPYLPSWEYVPDGEPYVFGDRVYIYGSHDFYNGDVFCMGDYVGYSAPLDDLGNWRYEGVIYTKMDEPLNPRGDGMLYAPDVTVGPDGRYYLFYVCSNVGNVSVAVCDTPAGRFEFYGHVHYEDGTLLGNREGDEPHFDPGVLTEGENTYLYTGFCAYGDKSRHGAMCTVLGPDMLTIVKEPKFVVPGCEYSSGSGFEGHEYFEAASIRKKDDKYIFVYSSIVMHELCYAVSDKPDEGFKYAGVLISNADLGIDSYKDASMITSFGANNHGSVIEINGKWYVFYHRHTNGTWYSRQVCAEELELNDEGLFKQAHLTSCGLNNGPLKSEGFYPAYIACNLFYPDEDFSIRENNDAVQPDITKIKVVQEGMDGVKCDAYITNFNNGAVAGFKYFDMKDVKKIAIFMHGYSNGKVTVYTDLKKEPVGEVLIETYNIWDKYEIDVNIEDGVRPLYFKYEGSGNPHFKGFTFVNE